VMHLEAALAIGGNLAGDRFQLLGALTNLGNITSEKDGPEAAIPVYEAALECAEKLRGTTGLSQSLALVRAQLHRNHASNLRKAGRLADAATAHDASLRDYDQVVAEKDSAPPWLLQQVATLECWRAALLRRLDRHDEATAGLVRFTERCDKLAAFPNQPELVAQSRAAAVEAFGDAAMESLPDIPATGRMALADTEAQLEQLRGICQPTPADSPLRSLLDESETLVRGVRLRTAIRDGDLAAAWQPLKEFIDADSVDAFPMSVRIDLAASLVAAGEEALYEEVIASLHKTLAAEPQRRPQVTACTDATRRCGVPDTVTAHIEESLGVGR
ncbi:MAG: hypothetical protein ACKOTB_02870, partial [Planctomycetia bacterium]